ncbi:hexitol phosphatase HxpB [Dyadobacter tibetensis]|uniref:hexitol phosphatase HxpB n=1 Tax=Dyadobacter tibetensis TaxID=1211851 RepID=UPI00046E5835|nr:hexitol phosphatase HxpB [Dyadobacter tibetensis]
MIKAAIFDMDGLLIDSEPIWVEAAKLTMQKINFDLTQEVQRQTTGLACKLFLEYCHKIQPWNTPTFEEMEKEILNYAHHHILEKALPMPGALELLKKLHQKGIKLAVASASHMELIEGVLDRLNIRDYFQVWHSGTLEAFTKPHPAVYLTTAQKLGLPPAQCLAFEDSFAGLQSAHSAGMITISVPAQEAYHDKKFDLAHYKLQSLEQFSLQDIQQELYKVS